MELALVVEKIVGYLYFILGWSLVLQKKFWINLVTHFDRQSLSLPFSALTGLIIGLTVVTVHNHWTMSPSVIVTLIGWIAVIKSTLFLLAPDVMLKWIPGERFLATYCTVGGGAAIVLSALILYGAYY